MVNYGERNTLVVMVPIFFFSQLQAKDQKFKVIECITKTDEYLMTKVIVKINLVEGDS